MIFGISSLMKIICFGLDSKSSIISVRHTVGNLGRAVSIASLYERSFPNSASKSMFLSKSGSMQFFSAHILNLLNVLGFERPEDTREGKKMLSHLSFNRGGVFYSFLFYLEIPSR